MDCDFEVRATTEEEILQKAVIFSGHAVAITLDPIQDLSANSSNSATPQIAASGSNLYMVWVDGDWFSPFVID